MPILHWPSVEVMNRVFQEFQADPGAFIGAEYLPLNTIDFAGNADTIRWEIYGPSTGMTRPHTPNTQPNFAAFPVLKSKETSTAYWKEGHRIGETDILQLRRAGSFSERYGRKMVHDGIKNLDLRLKSRMEWLRWQALQGLLSWDHNGVTRTIDFEVPEGNKESADVLWSDHEHADPIADLQAAIRRYRGTGSGRPDMIINSVVAGHLAQNQVIRDLVRQSSSVVQIGTDSIADLLLPLVGGIKRVRVYDEVFLDDDGIPHPFIPDDKVLLIGAGSGAVGEFASTPSLHNGSLDSPQPGSFVIHDDKTNEANPYYDIFAGIYGLPVIYHPQRLQVLTVA